jgi:hypothetical protein
MLTRILMAFSNVVTEMNPVRFLLSCGILASSSRDPLSFRTCAPILNYADGKRPAFRAPFLFVYIISFVCLFFMDPSEEIESRKIKLVPETEM